MTAVDGRLAHRVIVGLSIGILAVVAYLLLGHRPPAGVPSAVGVLPLLNACLNATSAGLITAGFLFIRRKQMGAHRACMLGALAVSALFMISYVAYHWLAGSRAFTGQGWIRPLYFFVLLSHIGLAAVLPPLVLSTLYLALRRELARHRRLARWTLPIWLYVSVTGVLVYLMAHRLGSS